MVHASDHKTDVKLKTLSLNLLTGLDLSSYLRTASQSTYETN